MRASLRWLGKQVRLACRCLNRETPIIFLVQEVPMFTHGDIKDELTRSDLGWIQSAGTILFFHTKVYDVKLWLPAPFTSILETD